MSSIEEPYSSARRFHERLTAPIEEMSVPSISKSTAANFCPNKSMLLGSHGRQTRWPGVILRLNVDPTPSSSRINEPAELILDFPLPAASSLSSKYSEAGCRSIFRQV